MTSLPGKKRGRPPLLGEKLDAYLKSYIIAMNLEEHLLGQTLLLELHEEYC